MIPGTDHIGLGLIGFGYWGPNLLRNFTALSGVTVRAICDADPARHADARAAAPHVVVTTDYRNLLDDPSIHAVAIATPLSSHGEIAAAALVAGKHVFIEKPLSRTSGEAAQLTESAACRHLVLMVDHTYVYSNAVARLRALLDGNELGHVFYYDSVRANLGRFRADVDVLWDLAVHDIAILDFLFGTLPVEVTATGAHCMARAGPGAFDLAYLSLRYASGMLAHIHVNWFSPIKIRRTMIGASRRMVMYDDLEPSDKLKIYDRGLAYDEVELASLADDSRSGESHQRRVGYRTGDMWAPRIEVTEPLASACAEFARCIRDGRTPRADGACGQRVVHVLEAASASLAQGGARVMIAPR